MIGFVWYGNVHNLQCDTEFRSTICEVSHQCFYRSVEVIYGSLNPESISYLASEKTHRVKVAVLLLQRLNHHRPYPRKA